MKSYVEIKQTNKMRARSRSRTWRWRRGRRKIIAVKYIKVEICLRTMINKILIISKNKHITFKSVQPVHSVGSQLLSKIIKVLFVNTSTLQNWTPTGDISVRFVRAAGGVNALLHRQHTYLDRYDPSIPSKLIMTVTKAQYMSL